MMKRLCIFLIILCSFFLSGCDFLQWQRYSDKENHFSILLPRFWKKEKDFLNTAVLALAPQKSKADKYQENINVAVNKVPDLPPDVKPEALLSTFFELSKEEVLGKIKGVYNISEGEIFAGLLKGKYLSFNTRVGDLLLRIFSAIWLKNKQVYVVTCSSEAKEFYKYEPLFKRSLKSIRMR